MIFMKRRLQRLCAGVLLSALLLTALSIPAAAASTGFSDVPATHWAAEEIRRAGELGLFQGDSQGRFGLGNSMTRGAFAVVLCRLFGWELVTPKEGSYTDNQDPAAWYYSAVETAYAHGAVTDQTDAFRPDDAITREESAVMLMRAMGYGTIAGLAQELEQPFTDVRTNSGYIAMAYHLGVIGGTSDTTFSPDKAATREQAAVMLMRVYDSYLQADPERVGIASSAEGLADLTGYTAVAVAAQRIIYAGGVRLVSTPMTEEEIAAVRAAAEAAGAAQLLHVSGTSTALKGNAGDTASLLAAAVTEGGYDGLFLDLAELEKAQKRSCTALVEFLADKLGDKLLYVAAEAPAWNGETYDGYDYAALGKAADKLVLRVAPYAQAVDGFPVAPLEPLEEVYYALAALKGQVDGSKLGLLLTTTGSTWVDGREAEDLTAAQIQALRGSLFTEEYYSSRYACAYLTDASEQDLRVVWYLDGEAVAQRARMGDFFGAETLCFSDLSSVAAYEGYDLLDQLP